MSVIGKLGTALSVACVLTACVPNGNDEVADDASVGDTPTISVTVPAERLTPFCQAMIELSGELGSGEVADERALIIDTYQSIVGEVPDVITSDFVAVLAALEANAPPPTDPTVVTVVTVADTTPTDEDPHATSQPTIPVPVTDASGSTIPSDGDPFFDEGYGPASSPAERVNQYVAFACRDTENNPGPPDTEPPVEADEDDTAG